MSESAEIVRETAEDLTGWSDRIESLIARTPGCCVDRVAVVAETGSTQDAGARLAGSTPGILVVAGRQTAGRGQHGKRWIDAPGCTLAVTFVVADDGRGSESLSLAGGLAAAIACRETIGGDGAARVRVKPPNDVVAVVDQAWRKLAGVLIERRSGCVLIGIGFNTIRPPTGWPGPIESSAIALSELGPAPARIELVERVLVALSRVLAMDHAGIEGAINDVMLDARAKVRAGV